ncbi:NACHT, LRR and PYD domains-containing protein 12-like [Onychostoma macrolepis]|uniref:NACHT, LRR and PYD domains-containing protein 12-like n=1 Tax=Onychostoma macrolepis TaxID=369639 RepID=UPI00272BEB25|nr:NACHT, LRR and PYD domains-containing protein 12-like [Onychostoma macrolepis]
MASEKLKPKQVSVGLTAKEGATANTPVLTDNTIAGAVTINYNNTAGNETQKVSETAEQQSEKKANLILKDFLDSHKSSMKNKAKCIFEGKKEKEAHLQVVYTELFITEGDMKDVNQEHEILKIDDAFKNKKTQDKPIDCNNIFTLLREKSTERNFVLTKGVAGIGKTVFVHKFILDWAEGKASKDIDCVFLLPFKEISRIKDNEFSLHEFLQKFYAELKNLEKSKLYERKLAFIFDGLDESCLPLNFKSEIQSVEERSSVDVLFTNLVKGNLLPSALVWVTSRPAAANQIPPEHVGLFTEVRGFTDQQKKQYFRKRITDKTQASRIISHIKTFRSLNIMCHIPVFCWITATVLQDIIINNSDISTTLTEMYIHFLLIQVKIKCLKYDEQEERECAKYLNSNRAMILKLAKLAFEQLKKKNIVFYEEDLKACGIDASKDTEFTGMIAEIFKKINGLHEKKLFCFVHLSVQEFLAAVHVFLCYLSKNMQELQFFFDSPKENVTLQELLQKAIDKAMKSQKGHLDLFLRFLMGITLESSQNLLQGLIPHTEDTTESIRQTTQYITQEQDKNISDEASVNLFYCLLELNDRSLYEELQRYLSSDAHPGRDLSSSMCSVLICVLLMSEKVLDDFNPKRFTSSQEGLTRLVPAVRCCRKALFDSCGFDETCCETVSSALQSSNSHLTELDLSNNDLKDSGVKLLSDGLKSPNCKLEILRLSGCMVTEEGCHYIFSALSSNTSHLRELDLSFNHPGDSGVKLLSEKQRDPDCSLEKLKLSGCMVTEEGCHYIFSALSSNTSHLRELDLSFNHPGDSGVKLLSEKQRDPDCSLEKLNVDHGGQSRITAGVKKYSHQFSLDLNTVNKHLSLSENNRVITRTDTVQPYPDHPDRFDVCRQVLCRESVCGRCYWEIEWSGREVRISVSYKSISRKGRGDECWFGRNVQSWSLYCSPDRYSFRHNNTQTALSVKPISRRIGVYGNVYRVGVYVDESAGTLSFYSVSDTTSLIHTVHTTFTQPLYPGFRVYGSVNFVDESE